MGACSGGGHSGFAGQPTSLESRCSIELPQLYDAYTSLVAGAQSVRIRGADYREVEYTQADLKQVIKLYTYWWQICGQGSSFPDLRDVQGASDIKRGGPTRVGDFA